jgi:hypothetical protein
LKTIDVLTFYSQNRQLNEHIQDLTIINQNNEYIIKGKLQEKDDQIKGLEDNVKSLKEEMDKVFKIIQQNPLLANVKPEFLTKSLN